MSRRTFWLAFCIVAAAVGAGAYRYVPDIHAPGDGRVRGEPGAARAATSAGGRAVVVEIAPVTIDTVVEDLRAVGTLLPDEFVVIVPEIAGRLARIQFREGQKVQAGDVLVTLDAEILRAELQKARSDLNLAQANNDRAATLARQGTGTLRARDEAYAAFLAAQANVALAKTRLDKATIVAPLTGIVGLRPVSVGAYVTPGTPIVELANVDPLKVDFRVPELQLRNLQVGQHVVITADAVPTRVFDGRIYAIDPIVDANGRAIRLRAEVPNPDRALSPGLFVRIRIIVERRPDAILVPESAVVAQTGRTFVYRLVDDRVAQVEVVLGQRRPGAVEVTSGLAPGDRVVIGGHQRLRDGALVEVVPASLKGS
ncbi:MAG: efflux RND transporter periplasmic adaptor subunit [Lautropia sp.]